MRPHERITYRITIDITKCNGCNNCTTACPVNAELLQRINMDTGKDARVIAIKNGVATVINPFRCDGCGTCMIVCPEDCIDITFIPLTEYEDTSKEKSKT